jgi:uncharacterized membrane protein YhaH (DUF805 family)/Tfp pilus assembly protein PilE
MSQPANLYGTPKAAVSEEAVETQPVKVFSVSGRMGRARYIAYGIGFYLVLAVIGGILAAALGQSGGVAVLVLMWVALLVIGFMLTIQRCHDFNTTGWLSLLLLVPLANLAFWFIPGTDGRNRYGPPTPPNGAGVIVVICIVPALFAVLGILAAVAIPAYGDYTQRARISEVILYGSSWRTAVTEHHQETGKLPQSVADLRKDSIPPHSGGPYGKVSLGQEGVLTLTLSEQMKSLADKTIVLQPKLAAGGTLSWDCTGGTLQPKYRPSSCRARP